MGNVLCIRSMCLRPHVDHNPVSCGNVLGSAAMQQIHNSKFSKWKLFNNEVLYDVEMCTQSKSHDYLVSGNN